MKVAIRKMGNSQGALIPKPILAQVGLEGTADLQVRDGVIEIRPVRRDRARFGLKTQNTSPNKVTRAWLETGVSADSMNQRLTSFH